MAKSVQSVAFSSRESRAAGTLRTLGPRSNHRAPRCCLAFAFGVTLKLVYRGAIATRTTGLFLAEGQRRRSVAYATLACPFTGPARRDGQLHCGTWRDLQ